MMGRLKHSSHGSQKDEEEYEGGEGDQESNHSSLNQHQSNDLNNIKSDRGLNDESKLEVIPDDGVLKNKPISSSKHNLDKIDFTPKEESKNQTSRLYLNSFD